MFRRNEMIDYERELNDEQRRVVMEGEGPLLVIAGAGSGKTRALTYRVARLLESGVSPRRILLATFTNKAARSMLHRVRILTQRDMEDLWGGTFHHIAHLTLRAYGELLGYDRRFTILDSEDARQIVHACLRDAGIHEKNDGFPKANVLAAILSLAANTDAGIDQILSDRYPYFLHFHDEILATAQVYSQKKRTLQAMDFDDLLINWRRILIEHPEVCNRYAERFRYILVDEYQDTNALQADIVDRLASRGRNLMVVGDDSQSIYAFRGANFANIMRFPEKYPDCRIFKLETNYRSTPEILRLANLSIQNNVNQFDKSLRAVRDGGSRPVFVPCRNGGQQARFVVQQISEGLRGGIPPGEIAILYRAHFHAMEIQMELTRQGIPFEIRSGIRFFEQAHIKDLTAYLRIAANPLDEVSWRRVLGHCPRVGKATANRVWLFVSSASDPHTAAHGPDFRTRGGRAAAPGLDRLQSMLRILQQGGGQALPAVIGALLDGGYRTILREKYPDASSREEDIEQLALFSSRFDSVSSFLSEMALLTGAEEEHDRMSAQASDRIVLTTIHQAKGLEWGTVFLIWCCEDMLPLARALADPEGEEEERRLFYVATTRAKDRLYLCCPAIRSDREWGATPLLPSRFIRELGGTGHGVRNRPYERWTMQEW